VVSGWVKHLTEKPFATFGERTGCITGYPETDPLPDMSFD